MLVGYARVSTPDQHLALQRDALKKAGCKRIFSDVASGATAERPGLTKALEFVRRGDALVVWKLDRLGRSLQHLIESVRQLHKRKVGFRSLQESIDTTTSGGKLIFHVFGALAEFERDIIRERTNAGLAAARVRGRKGGRPRVLDDKKLALARSLRKDNTSPAVICATLGISRSSLYRYLASDGAKAAPAATSATKPLRAMNTARRTPSQNARGNPHAR
jgi:DNA invertase Pin-like site-specific DNA recombinase